jgi:hypothetical protein
MTKGNSEESQNPVDFAAMKLFSAAQSLNKFVAPRSPRQLMPAYTRKHLILIGSRQRERATMKHSPSLTTLNTNHRNIFK